MTFSFAVVIGNAASELAGLLGLKLVLLGIFLTFEFLGELDSLSAGDFHVHDFLHKAAILLTVDGFGAFGHDLIAEITSLLLKDVDTLVMSIDIPVDAINIFNEVEVVLEVSDDDIEEEE